MEKEYTIRNYLILPYDTLVSADSLEEAKSLAMSMCREGLIEPNFDLAFWSERSKVVEENINAIATVIEMVNKKEILNNA
jgi:hypothetical protein